MLYRVCPLVYSLRNNFANFGGLADRLLDALIVQHVLVVNVGYFARFCNQVDSILLEEQTVGLHVLQNSFVSFGNSLISCVLFGKTAHLFWVGTLWFAGEMFPFRTEVAIKKNDFLHTCNG